MECDRPVLAKYASSFQVGHNNFEFLLDFGQFETEGGDTLVHTRIVGAPAYIKAFWELLGESIQQYEAEFGAIPSVDGEEPE